MSSSHSLLRQIKKLRDLLLEMTDLVDEQFAHAVDALLNRDLELAEEVVARDDEVDALELDIDEQCERILALYQPVAVDLRMLIVAVKINTDLERMGDHCKNMARNTKYVQHAPEALACTRLREMADTSRQMLHKVQDAFLNRDRVLARRVLAMDQQVDRLHEENFYALVDHAKEHPDQAEPVAHLITASKALERISDHAKNIAEGVVFLIEGVDIRHRSAQESSKGRSTGMGNPVQDPGD